MTALENARARLPELRDASTILERILDRTHPGLLHARATRARHELDRAIEEAFRVAGRLEDQAAARASAHATS